MSPIKLFGFQEQEASKLTQAIEDWIQAYASEGPSYLGKTVIPFVGHLKAVTGAGKTPILAKVVGDLEHALVLWTSKSSAVVDQTVQNLGGKYSHLLPTGTRVVRERPTKGEWEELIESKVGLTIWVTTVGSWNEAEAAEAGGSEHARLNMHRPQKDWGGDKSPWEQLRTMLERPLWVVYDESHNQTLVQLDQLTGLSPIGFLMASATPPSGGQFERYAEVVKQDPILAPIAARGRVAVATKDVVDNQLLKHTIAVENFNSDADVLLDETVELHRNLTQLAVENNLPVRPKALYIVEKSNPSKGEVTSRPVAIWEHLVSRNVDPANIAIYTQTRIVPSDATRISSLSELAPHHTHIISNRALQEGWDDPEAYIEYFDDESNSYTRIAQVIGRALRQPGANHFPKEELNTATLFIRVPNKSFQNIIDGLKRELALYSTAEDGDEKKSAIRLRTRKEPLEAVPLKAKFDGKLSLPQYQLGEAELDDEIAKTAAMSRSPFAKQDLTAAGGRTSTTISLRGQKDTVKYQIIAASMRRKNGEYLRRRIQIRSRHCGHLLEPKIFTGPAFDQWSCSGSVAQSMLGDRAASIVQAFESSVALVPNEIEGEEEWNPSSHLPSTDNFYSFNNAAHAKYSKSALNDPEYDFARALDDVNQGVWLRNPTRGDGYGIELPMKVGTSSTFYPDFLWWVNDDCFAIDPTGEFLLEAKVRGKLLQLDLPKVVLLTAGKVKPDWTGIEDTEGFTIVRAKKNVPPAPEYVATLDAAVRRIAGLKK